MKRVLAETTLGSTSVICTDKTGTLTLNRMRVARGWTSQGVLHLRAPLPETRPEPAEARMARAVVACNNAQIELNEGDNRPEPHPDNEIGDPTELALLHMARSL